MIETMNLFSKAEFIIGGRQTKQYDSQCAIQLDRSALSTMELSIIKREEDLPCKKPNATRALPNSNFTQLVLPNLTHFQTQHTMKVFQYSIAIRL